MSKQKTLSSWPFFSEKIRISSKLFFRIVWCSSVLRLLYQFADQLNLISPIDNLIKLSNICLEVNLTISYQYLMQRYNFHMISHIEYKAAVFSTYIFTWVGSTAYANFFSAFFKFFSKIHVCLLRFLQPWIISGQIWLLKFFDENTCFWSGKNPANRSANLAVSVGWQRNCD